MFIDGFIDVYAERNAGICMDSQSLWTQLLGSMQVTRFSRGGIENHASWSLLSLLFGILPVAAPRMVQGTEKKVLPIVLQ
jgi:hypothetical protein